MTTLQKIIKTVDSDLSELIKQQAPRFAGKLLLRQEIPHDESAFQQLLHANAFQAIPSFIKIQFNKQCRRCGNTKQSLLGTIPCEACHQIHLYCRKCIDMGRIMECEPLYQWTGCEPDWPFHRNACSWEGELTPFQKQASDRIVHAIHTREKELLVWAVCGAGKTEMIFAGLTEALRRGQRICIATPRADVVRELKPRMARAFSGVSVQALYGGSEEKEATAQLILATTHQLLRFRDAFDLLVIDEIDAFPFHADPSLPFAADKARRQPSTTIYLTATPRKDQHNLLSRKKLAYTFVPLRFHGYPLPVPQLKLSFGLQKDLAKYLPPKTLQKWLHKRDNPSRQLLIFVPTIQLAEKLKEQWANYFKENKIISMIAELDSVHSKDTQREEKVQAFRDGKLTVLITTTILERGVTFPSVDVVILDAGHDVFDEAALVQIAGRAGRSPDDPTGEVLFLHDGKTEAMLQAVQSIKKMNRLGGASK